jgi:AdoMet dependent proline di-methyltransferase
MSKAADPESIPAPILSLHVYRKPKKEAKATMPSHHHKRSTVHPIAGAAPLNGVLPPVVAAALLVDPGTIKGSDDMGNFYHSQSELAVSQQANRSAWYAANAEWWMTGGGGGKTDEDVMTGDEGGLQDAEEGLAFLDRFLLLRSSSSSAAGGSNAVHRTGHTILSNSSSSSSLSRAVDVGAGVGRITKHILLKRYNNVYLVEGDSGWSKRSRVYLGKKRAGRCTFDCLRLENLRSRDILAWTGEAGADLIWLQWTLQYLTDTDAVAALKNLAAGLVVRTGILILKENRPYGVARTDRFQMDTPGGGSGRYDITRTDDHHRYLLQQAGLTVQMTEQGDETNTYAVYK